MQTSEDCFHLGVKALIQNDEGKVLLLKVNTAKLRNSSNPYWDIPGGRVQQGSTVDETLAREVEEELGITGVRVLRPLGMILANIRIPLDTGDVGLILSVYLCNINSDSRIRISDEHTEFRWFSVEEAAQLLQVKYPEEFIVQVSKLGANE